MKIKSLKTGALNENDRLAIATLLIKAGYTVRLGREKADAKGKYEYFVEASEGDDVNERHTIRQPGNDV